MDEGVQVIALTRFGQCDLDEESAHISIEHRALWPQMQLLTWSASPSTTSAFRYQDKR